MSAMFDLSSFNDWLGTLPHKHKIVIAGNHDLILDEKFYKEHWKSWHRKNKSPVTGAEAVNTLLVRDY